MKRILAGGNALKALDLTGCEGRNFDGLFGGGGRSRTYDAADMSRVDSDSNLLDLLAEILLEATDGDNPR